MKNKLNFIFFWGSLLFFSSCQRENILPTQSIICPAKDSIFQHPKHAIFNAIIDKYIRLGLPGISVLAEDSSGVYLGSGGFADIDKGIAYSPCHISKAASITKLLVGTLTLKLQEQGKLNIEDPISKYIDSKVLAKINKAEGKTLHQLMNHTTGIFDVITSSSFYLAVLNNPNKTWTQEELLSFVYGKKGYDLDSFPVHYSNTNTLLLSMCIEKATGENHAKLLRELVLNPLEMNNTYYQGHDEIPASAAQGYFDLHNNGTLCNVSNLITGSGNGYGGIFSNIFDLHIFIKALFVKKTILAQPSLDLMQSYLQESDDFFTGISNIKKFTHKSAFGIGHTGRDLGYSADLFYFPQKGRTMVFFVNYGTNGKSSLKQVFKDFENELADAVLQ